MTASLVRVGGAVYVCVHAGAGACLVLSVRVCLCMQEHVRVLACAFVRFGMRVRASV